MNITSKIDQKTLLAKLFASENIKIRHTTQINTAAFDVKERVLYLPVWKNVTNELYNLLISHEVAHALYTPQNKMEEVIAKGQMYKSLVNIIEDARIEKMIQKKFPGLKRDYYKGYSDLLERGFFDQKSRNLTVENDIEQYNFIDRINLHFKIGNHVHVPIKDEREKDIIRRVDSCVTFNEVLKLADELMEELEEEIEQLKQESGEEQEGEGQEGEGQGEGQEGRGQGEGEQQIIDVDQITFSDSGKSADGSDPSGESNSTKTKIRVNKINGKPSSMGNSSNDGNVDIVSLNKFDIGDISKELIDYKVNGISYGKIPGDKILQKFIVSNKKLLTDIKENMSPSGIKMNKLVDNKMVNFMHKIFEQKKAASNYRKISISKTGQIDTNKLHNYRLKDDIFLKSSVYYDGKNHGVIMLVDFSGSMSNVLENVVLQVLELMEFCRKSKIKYKIFSFTSGYFSVDFEGEKYKNNDIRLDESTCLVELFNSEMGLSDRDLVIENIQRMCNGDNTCRYITTGGTPLISSLLVMNHIIKKFRSDFGIEVMNLIVLSDGEPTDSLSVYGGGNLLNRGNTSEKIFIEINEYKNFEIEKLSANDKGIRHSDMFMSLMKMYKNLYDINTIHFDLVGSSKYALNDIKYKYGLDDIKNKKLSPFYSIESKKLNNFYDSYFVIESDSVFNDKKVNLSRKTATEIKEYMTSENSSFRLRSVIMKNFCEIVSKKLLT
jgi:hypothetical protein